MYASLLVGHAKKCPNMDKVMPPMWAAGSTLSLPVWPVHPGLAATWTK